MYLWGKRSLVVYIKWKNLRHHNAPLFDNLIWPLAVIICCNSRLLPHFEILTEFLLELKVRKSACQSLQRLTLLSVKFAHEALNFLLDVLNDDSVVVRLQALETMHHLAISGYLKVQEKHLHMVCFSSLLNTWAVYSVHNYIFFGADDLLI